MTIVLREPFEDLTFMTPLSEANAAGLVRFLAGAGRTVLDLGCGWAELLLRVVAASEVLRGTGVDSGEAAIAHGRRLARERGLADRVTLVHGDARTGSPAEADAVICIGASQIWATPGDAIGPVDYAAALAAIRRTLPRGGRAVYGEGIWSRPPTAAAAAPLAGRLDEFVSLAELVELAVGQGFMPVAVHEASLREWDEFESGYGACYAHWLGDHDADDPDAAEVRERAARQRAAYHGGYRGILGLGYLSLVAV